MLAKSSWHTITNTPNKHSNDINFFLDLGSTHGGCVCWRRATSRSWWEPNRVGNRKDPSIDSFLVKTFFAIDDKLADR